MRLGTIAQLWRYPVKSMAGERLERAVISRRGIPGDRGWALYDETRQGITNAKRLPLLRQCHVQYATDPASDAASPPVRITLPDGSSIEAEATDSASRLSAFVGRAVHLRALGPLGGAVPARIPGQSESEETLRALNGLVPGEPMPDLEHFTIERLRQLRHDNFFDAYPIHLLSRSTLTTLSRLAPASIWDERRFRPNVLIHAIETEGFPELDWVGWRLRVGACVLQVVVGCPRCVMTTQPADDLPHDPGVMRTLVRETKHVAGVYAQVIEPGEVRVGDAIEVVPGGEGRE